MTNGVFSDYEIDKTSVKFDGDSSFTSMDCVGSLEETLNTKIVSKNCRGKLAKQTVKGSGDGTLALTAHIPWAVYKKSYGLVTDKTVNGVMAYGESSRHKSFCMVCHVTDEDGAEKLRAYPKCIITTGLARKTENGAEEVAEAELEITVMPDDYGFCVYETILGTDGDGADSTITNNWMTSFTPSLVAAASTQNDVTLTLTACTSTNTTTAINDNTDFVTTFVANSDYSLPASITVTEGGTTATAGTDYIYNNTTGLFAFPNVGDDLVITVTATSN